MKRTRNIAVARAEIAMRKALKHVSDRGHDDIVAVCRQTSENPRIFGIG